tara:strand:- start:355 stop:951 length:597 start_codon:yes stop_codon:yes gene_type:complete
MATSYYKTKYDRKFTPGQGLPTISTDLDSVRTYQFEIHFFGLPEDITNQADLTLAAKKVGGLEMKNEAIVVDRVNDKVHYPGKTTPGELTVDFDNLYLRETASDLYRYFRHTYDPLTGEMTKSAAPGGGAGSTFKADKVEVVMLDNTMTPHSTVELYGVYPMSWSASEFNYSTNQFSQLTVNFKYDFMNVYDYANPTA